MFKQPWFTLVIGLMAGLALGYVLAERQPVPPAETAARSRPAAARGGLPEGHPPVGDGLNEMSAPASFRRQIAEIDALLTNNPDDPGLLVAMGDAHFELARATRKGDDWQQARTWYERALAEGRDGDPNVMTDLAVVYRNLEQPERALDLLDRAIAADDGHWQAWFNKVVILNLDMHEHDQAREAFLRLKGIAASNPEVPDLDRLEREVMGS